MVDSVLAAELAIFAILVFPTIFCLIRHLPPGLLGWTYLVLFCILRIVGGALGVSSPAPKATQIVSNIGLSPLLLAVSGIVHEARFLRKPELDKKMELVTILALHIAVTTGLALLVVGVSGSYSAHSTSGDLVFIKVGLAFLTVCWALLTLYAAVSLLLPSQSDRSAPAYRESTILLGSASLAIVIIGIRLFYTWARLTSRDHSTGSQGTRVGLDLLPDVFATTILLAGGIWTRRAACKHANYKLESGHADRVSGSKQPPNPSAPQIPSTIVADSFSRLPHEESALLRRQVDSPTPNVGITALYRFSSNKDILYLAISTVAAIVAGAVQPLMTIIFGHLQGIFQEYFTGNHTYLEFVSNLNRLVVYFVYLGITSFVANYIATVGFIYVGEHITGKIRSRYLDSCLRQNVGLFDNLGAGEVTTRITADANKVQDGISEKVGLTITALSTFITAFIVSFASYWKLTLILLSTVVVLLLVMLSGTKLVVKHTIASFIAYAPAGSLADEVLGTIRNTVAFGAQKQMAERHDAHLARAERSGFKAKAIMGVMVAAMTSIVYLNYALSFYVGSRFVISHEVELSKVITVMMSVMIGAFSLSNVSPNIQAFIQALGAASKIYAIIDRNLCADLDPVSSSGLIPRSFHGSIRLEQVKHIYPSRPDVIALDNVSLDIPAGKTTALVGSSGSGKSTIVGLLQRFYYPVGGRIYLDDIDISLLNLRWLRRTVALVEQEPVLFHDTVYENIRKGLIGTGRDSLDKDVEMQLITEAAQKANAHDFISSLPQGYETNVGQRGGRLSGGQKQRIAIARAIVSDPKILLLDEATSALDTKSEGIVQLALKNASKGRTTVVIAHRLSTIRDADNIVVMQQGRIVEQGSHNVLLDQGGAYCRLVSSQAVSSNEEPNDLPTAEVSSVYSESYWDETLHNGDCDGRALVSDSESTLVPLVELKDAKADDDMPQKQSVQGTETTTGTLRKWIRARKSKSKTSAAKQKSYSFWPLVKLIASLNKPEWKEMCIAILACVIGGSGFPTQSVFFAKLIDTLSRPMDNTTIPDIKHRSSFWSLMYLMLGLVQLLALATQGVLFGRCSERLIHRARDLAFKAYLRQDMEFFDRDENATGALTSFLSTQTTHLAGLSGATLGVIIMVVTTIVTAICLALAIGWKLALVCISTIPILLACGFFRFWMLAHYQLRAQVAYQQSAAIASESITAIRTIAALTMEHEVSRQYTESLTKQRKSSLRSILKSSLLYAASQSLTFGAFALGFWYGGDLIAKREYTQFQLFVVFSAVILGSQSAGTLLSFAPDVGRAASASADLKALFDRPSTIEKDCSRKNEADHDRERTTDVTAGAVELRDVHFCYPSRPHQLVLKGIDIKIRPGQFVAFVGASGSGKSTAIALLERFYDPSWGSVLIDGQPLTEMDLTDYRSTVALVSQEPNLYSGTIRDNILLGAVSDKPVSDAEIESACRAANIWDYVSSLPDGLNSATGPRGVLLSGGQKQRIAIARALIRKPRILLLDEATSALDGESEKVVQDALDKAAEGRTTIAVAHRLSTVHQADCIYVFEHSVVVESGDHAALMRKNGRYAELARLQRLDK